MMTNAGPSVQTVTPAPTPTTEPRRTQAPQQAPANARCVGGSHGMKTDGRQIRQLGGKKRAALISISAAPKDPDSKSI